MGTLTIAAWITIVVIITKYVLMVQGRIPAEVISLGTITILIISGVLTTDEAMGCFSTETVVMVGVLCILVGALIHSGVLQWVVNNMLGHPTSYNSALLRLMIPVSLLSSLVNNNAVVALFINAVKLWSKKLHLPPSKLLYPISYAAGYGGVCTIIGTSSNLVVADYWHKSMGKSLDLFFPFLPGLICCIVGLVAIILLKKVIPWRKSPEDSFESTSDYTVELLVPTDCPYIGETVTEARLHTVNGGHLVEIVRFDREVISPVPKDEFILGGDHLVYTGQINTLLELRDSHGLVNATHHVFSIEEVVQKRKLYMATVKANSKFKGNRMCDLDFEDENSVVLVAVTRAGERIKTIPREVRLRAGDTLLLEGPNFNPRDFEDDLLFFDTVALPVDGMKTLRASLIIILMVALSAFNVVPILNSCIIAALLMLIFKCISPTQLQNSIDWNLIIQFAGALCIGKAIEVSGIAQLMSDTLLTTCQSNALYGFILFCGCAMLATEVIQDSAVAAIAAPVALMAANQLHANPLTFMLGLMMCVGYTSTETNTMVSGPAGYTFGDNYRIAVPLNIIMFITIILVVNLFYPL